MRVEARGAALLLTFGPLALLAPPPVRADGARIHMHDAGGYAADGVLYQPDGAAPAAAILLIPDERGVTPEMEQAAARYAAAGYLTLAVDLNRSLPSDQAQHTDEQTRHDLDAALAFIASQDNPKLAAGAAAVGAVGWGSGATWALRLGEEAKVRAVALEDPVATTKPRPAALPVKVLRTADRHGRGGAADSQHAELDFFAHAFKTPR